MRDTKQVLMKKYTQFVLVRPLLHKSNKNLAFKLYFQLFDSLTYFDQKCVSIALTSNRMIYIKLKKWIQKDAVENITENINYKLNGHKHEKDGDDR